MKRIKHFFLYVQDYLNLMLMGRRWFDKRNATIDQLRLERDCAYAKVANLRSRIARLERILRQRKGGRRMKWDGVTRVRDIEPFEGVRRYWVHAHGKWWIWRIGCHSVASGKSSLWAKDEYGGWELAGEQVLYPAILIERPEVLTPEQLEV